MATRLAGSSASLWGGRRQLYPRPIARSGFNRDTAFSPMDYAVKVPTGFHAVRTGNTLKLHNHRHARLMRMRGLNPAKFVQRREVAENMPRDGTILHVFGGGQSALFRTVYKNKARRHLIIDRTVKTTDALEREVNGKVFAFQKSSGEFFGKEMPLMDLKDLTLVDFDPYGSPGHDVQAFFANYKPTHAIRVNLTDGYALRLVLLKADGKAAEREVYSRYLTTNYGDGGRANQIRLLDNLMREMGRRHNLNVRRLNAAHGDQKTVYAGYLVSPR